MPSFVPHVLVGIGITLAIWLLSDDGWPGLVIGAVLAFALWLMLQLRPIEEGQDRRVPAVAYLATAAVGLPSAISSTGSVTRTRLVVGRFILAGLVIPASTTVTRGSGGG